VIAAGLKLLNGLKSGHWDQVMIRFYYFPVVGLL